MFDMSAPTFFIALIFALAGMVKGVTGMGLPTVSMGLLGLLMTPGEAAALLIIPASITNIWQFVIGSRRCYLLRRTWPMLIAITIATWVSAGLLVHGATSFATCALGMVLVVYAGIGLAHVRLHIPRQSEPWLAPLVGAVTGVVTGATGVFVVPAVPYLQALDLRKEDLVQALGLSFTISTLALAGGLWSRGAFHLEASGRSLLCAIPALAGMFLGQWIRTRVDAAIFRRLFFLGLLILGADLAMRAWL